ncbi:MAG: hypothetical protein R3E31_15030 [Chloroflexota bacterium]
MITVSDIASWGQAGGWRRRPPTTETARTPGFASSDIDARLFDHMIAIAVGVSMCAAPLNIRRA